MKIRIFAAALFLLLPLAARAAEPTESHLQAAEELLRITKVDTFTDQSVDAILKAQIAEKPELAGVEDVMRQFFAKYVSWEALRPQLLALYTDTFTESELRELIAFYKTPVGQKSIEVMPGLFQKGIDIGQKLVQDHLGELREAVRKKLEENAKKP